MNTIIKSLLVSDVEPMDTYVLWAKPVNGLFELKLFNNGQWHNCFKEFEQIDYVGSVKDSASANTFNGVRNYAKEMSDSLLGTKTDTYSDLTLYGLKAYIDNKIKGLKKSLEDKK